MRVDSSRLYFALVVVNMKNQLGKLVKILITFPTIELSNNLFVGKISQVIEKLNSLKGLNFLQNIISGAILQTLGNLRNLK
ncbi:hypothetical protein AHAS_Ahas08G0036800 [Arachis hypogaea]